MIADSVLDLVGNTPLLKIDPEVHGIPNVTLYAKLEMMNPFGSVKDRIAVEMLRDRVDNIKKENKTVVESSSGNTAKALAAICGIHQVPLQVVSTRIKVKEVRTTLKMLGTQVVELPGISECPDPTNPKNPYAIIETMVSTHPDKYFHTDQYFNEENIQAHKKTGKEIHDELGDIDFFFSVLGTCGTSRGVGAYLRAHQKHKPQIVGVITQGAEYVPGGRNQNELYETGFFDQSFYDSVVSDSPASAIEAMQLLHKRSGVLCGPTSGLTYCGLRKYFQDHPAAKPTKVVFVVCDRFEPYLHYVDGYLGQQNEKQMSEEDYDVPAKQSKELYEAVSKDSSSFQIIDMRTSYAFGLGHIKESINIPEHMLDDLIKGGKPFPQKPIVIVCPVGVKGARFVHRLREKGYDAYSLHGGLHMWQKLDLPLVVDS